MIYSIKADPHVDCIGLITLLWALKVLPNYQIVWGAHNNEEVPVRIWRDVERKI